MKCPHCSVDLRLVDRPDRRCRKCQKKIALEPRQDPLGLSDLRLRALADKLSDQGKLFYTATQLFYAASRKAVDAQYQQTPGWLGCLIPIGIFMGVMFAGVSDSVLGCFGGIGLVALIGFVLHQYFRRYGPRRVTLSNDLGKFQEVITSRWPAVYGAPPVGWLDQRIHGKLDKRQPASQPMQAVLVCPTLDLLYCLQANGAIDALGLGFLLLTEAPLTAEERTILTLLQQCPHLPLLLLHDASIDGCLWVQTVRQRLGLSDRQRIINLGLHPRQAMRDHLMRLRQPANAEQLAQLKTLVNLATGQTTGQPAPLGQLTAAEYEWLAQGYYTPLLALPPKRLLKTVTQAVLATTPATVQPQLGFMDWPAPQGVV